MNKKCKRHAGKAVLFLLIVVFIFVTLEFTDKDNKIPFTQELGKFFSGFSFLPEPLRVWMEGELTFAGMLVGLIGIFISITFIFQLISWIRTANYQNQRSQSLKLLGSMMLFLWSIGWALYLQAVLYSNLSQPIVNSELLLRSAIAALDMFMLDIDSNILSQIHSHALLKGAISFVCLLSFACTVTLLVSLISARLWAYLKLSYRTRIKAGQSHLYLFFGMNHNMELLSDSIQKEDGMGIRIFIERTRNGEGDENEEWSHLKTMLTHRQESFQRAKEKDARLALTSCRINTLTNTKDVFGEAGLNNIKKKVNKLKRIKRDAELHLFFLSDNEAENIESVGVIRNDQTINDAAENGVKVIIYCQARRNSVTRVIENTSLDTAIEVHIIDTAYQAVGMLKTKEHLNLQPVNFVNFKEDGTTTSEFNALVIGFNEVGQDYVRFLYEYGAFVSSDKSEAIKRSPFCCHVVDPDMKEIAPQYMDTHLRKGKEIIGEKYPLIALDSQTQAYVNLHSFGYKDEQFISLLNEICEKLNYVVIAIDDGVEGVKLAIWILKHAIRMKKDLRNFRIVFYNPSSDNSEQIERFVEYYNGLSYAEIISTAKEKPENENEPCKEIIHSFGRAEEIYSFQSIVNNQLRKEAWLYYNSYNGVVEKTDNDFASLSDEEKATGNYCSVSKPDYAWNIRRQLALGIKIDGASMYSGVMSIRRKEAQDMENALHRHTKRLVALKALGNETMLRRIESGIRNNTITRNDSNLFLDQKYEDKQLNTLMTTLAQLEHLRWNASHQILGYVHGQEKDERRLEHDCLVDWDNLPSDKVRGYDYKVVERSFRLADEERERHHGW